MPDLWLFFHACGHPFGVHTADGRSETERQAWNRFYDTERERRVAESRGVTCRGVDWATYRADWLKFLHDGCGCDPAAAPVPAAFALRPGNVKAPVPYDDAPQWQKLTNVFGPCRRCNRPGRPLFRYQLEADHFDVDQPWTDEHLCNIEPYEEGCFWCDRPKDEPFTLCPPCYGLEAAAERAALDAALQPRAVFR